MEQSRIDDYSHTEAMKRAKRANLSRDSLPTRRKGGGRSRDLEPESESESESESASADEEASDTESESGGGGGGGESETGSSSGGGDEWRRERRGDVDRNVEVRSPISKGGKR